MSSGHYSELDLWSLKVDQLKEHMRDLGIYKKCSSLKKEALIEKIKDFYRLQQEDDDNSDEKIDDINNKFISSNASSSSNGESRKKTDSKLNIKSSVITVNSGEDNDDGSDCSVDIKQEEQGKRKRKHNSTTTTPTKKQECKSEYISPSKKEKLEIKNEKSEFSTPVKSEKVVEIVDSDDDILNSSIFDNLGIVTPPRSVKSSQSSSRVVSYSQPSSSQDISPRISAPVVSAVSRTKIELPTSPPKSDEKRARRFIPKCPARIVKRIERALSQKLFLVERTIKSEHEERFVVLGSTGNIYSVTICTESSCSCPDFEGGNMCKHILFIMLKVLRVDATSYLIYQNALLKGELECIFQRAPPTVPSSNIASAEAISQYKHLKGESIRHPLNSHTTCPICCDKFSTRREQSEAEFCLNCGINVHSDCLHTWKGFKSDYPCPVCKTKKMGQDSSFSSSQSSQSSSQSSSQRVRENEGYLNLSEFQPGTRNTRDTSTYARWRDEYWD